jgi:hypothetical protein
VGAGWRDAVRQDRSILEAFVCTDPAPRRPDKRPLPHPKPWELSVQTWIHGLHPPSGPSERLRLGFVPGDDSLAAVGEVCSVGTDGGLVAVKLTGLAITQRHRGQGGTLADEAVGQMIDQAKELALAQGASGLIAIAWAHPLNVPSHRMLARNGFRRRGQPAPDVEDWVLVES